MIAVGYTELNCVCGDAAVRSSEERLCRAYFGRPLFQASIYSFVSIHQIFDIIA